MPAKRFWSSTPIHPFLLAAYAVLALAANNISEIGLQDAWRAIFLALLACLVLFIAFRLLYKDWRRAGLAATATLLLFFNYGHIYTTLKPLAPEGVFIVRHRYLVPLWAAIWLIWIWWLARGRMDTRRWTSYLNTGSVILLLIPLFTITTYSMTNRTSLSASNLLDQNINTANVHKRGGEFPDIYFIILDGYAREDILKELYHYDNADFLEALESRGFFVLDDSRSNYNKTVLSLAATLNLDYVNYLADEMKPTSRNQEPLIDLINYNLARRYLAERGYQFVALESEYIKTRIANADIYIQLKRKMGLSQPLNSFEGIVIESTMLLALFESPLTPAPLLDSLNNREAYDIHRDSVRFTLSELGEIATMEGPQFIFAHIISPHPPFVFGANGEAVYPHHIFSLQDGSAFRGSREEYIEGYRNQIAFLDQLVLEAIDEILSNSEIPPVIILQSDHGPGAYLDWNSLSNTNISERLRNLNAIYLPGKAKSQLYASMSSVNTFRVVFNHVFDAGYELLPDQSYYVDHVHIYEFIPVSP